MRYESFHKTISFQGQAEELLKRAIVLFVWADISRPGGQRADRYAGDCRVCLRPYPGRSYCGSAALRVSLCGEWQQGKGTGSSSVCAAP